MIYSSSLPAPHRPCQSGPATKIHHDCSIITTGGTSVSVQAASFPVNVDLLKFCYLDHQYASNQHGLDSTDFHQSSKHMIHAPTSVPCFDPQKNLLRRKLRVSQSPPSRPSEWNHFGVKSRLGTKKIFSVRPILTPRPSEQD